MLCLSPRLRFQRFRPIGALQTLGEQLALAHLQRKEFQRNWAARLGVSVPTLVRLEKGDPSVSMGVYASALWLLRLSDGLVELADPAKDMRALESDVRQASQLRAARTRASMARLPRNRSADRACHPS